MEMENILFDYIKDHIDLTQDEKKLIKDLSLIREYKKGTVLVQEGKRSNDNYFILKGCLRCYYIIDGEEKTTEFYTELEVLSPACVIEQKPSEYYVACLEDTVLLVSNPEIEQESFTRFPRFESLCRVLSEKLAAKNQAAFNTFKTSSPEQRYINLLKTRPNLFQRVPQHQLASYLGITPQSLSRLRRRIVTK